MAEALVPDGERPYVPVNLKRELVDMVDRAREDWGLSRDAFVADAVRRRLEDLGVGPKPKKRD